MAKIRSLQVFYGCQKVGTMAFYQERLAAFEYDREWLAEGFAISPFSLPMHKKVFIPASDPFDGIFGIFADSLPDGWGRLLVDRLMLRNHTDPRAVGNLNRLAIVGNTGMGALTYEPDYRSMADHENTDLDRIAEECNKILRSDNTGNLDEIFRLGGSSGGARPKILTEVDKEEWIIKFPSSEDGRHIGRQEYEYSVCAKACGVQMEKTRLFPSAICDGYFGTRRFDRRRSEDGERERIHMASVSALLETSHRIPNMDYDILMKLTLELTKDFAEVEKLYRLMCFNVFSHNRDDHSKNFSYLYDKVEGRWILAPAYDLTYSCSLGGEHATTVHGNGMNPGMEDVLAVAKEIGIQSKRARNIARDIRECVTEGLGEYLEGKNLTED